MHASGKSAQAMLHRFEAAGRQVSEQTEQARPDAQVHHTIRLLHGLRMHSFLALKQQFPRRGGVVMLLNTDRAATVYTQAALTLTLRSSQGHICMRLSKQRLDKPAMHAACRAVREFAM